MDPIKSFIYLDDYKMYSISSQIFKGMTEYIISNSEKKLTRSKDQKPELFSGQVIGDIAEQSNNETEKKFLNDYAYTLFEDELRKNNRVLDINKDNIDDTVLEIDNYSFVAIKSRVIFNDYKTIENTTSVFNDLGYSIGMIRGYSDNRDAIDGLQLKNNATKDRNQKARNDQLIKAKSDIKKYLELDGLQMSDHFLKAVEFILNYGYEGQFEIQAPINTLIDSYLFSTTINRQMLKESESTLIKKYSRETEKELVIFGIPIQTQPITERIITKASLLLAIDSDVDIKMKEAFTNVITQLGSLERTFTGKLDYEYVIDPIAVYLEI